MNEASGWRSAGGGFFALLLAWPTCSSKHILLSQKHIKHHIHLSEHHPSISDAFSVLFESTTHDAAKSHYNVDHTPANAMLLLHNLDRFKK